jgi:hypothetical protein
MNKATIKSDGKEQDLPYKLIRSTNSGVHAGYLISPEGTDVVLVGSRRIWRWEGAVTLSELATNGTKKPKQCKFGCPVLRIHVFGVCEILDVTPKAQKVIQDEVPIWES